MSVQLERISRPPAAAARHPNAPRRDSLTLEDARRFLAGSAGSAADVLPASAESSADVLRSRTRTTHRPRIDARAVLLTARVLLAALCLGGMSEAAAQASPPAPDAPPRIAVVPRLEPDASQLDPSGWADAVAARLREAAPGRDVRAMPTSSRAECDDVCVGGRLAAASAQMGVALEVRVEGPARGPAVPRLVLRLIAPVSGQALADPVEVVLVDGAPSFDPAPLVARFPAPPPPPARLVVAIDVDGATVALDGVELGQSPVAPFEVREGTHELTVRAPGHEAFTRRVEVPASGLRVDVRLQPAADEAARLAAAEAGTTFDTVETSDPLWKKWWLWAAVGGAVVVGLVIGIAVAASGGGGDGNAFPVPPIPGRMP